MWCMQRTNIYLAAEQCEALDGLAAEEGISRAEVIRRLIDAGLAGRDNDVAGDVAAIEDSFGALSEVEAVTRSADGRSVHLDRMWRLGE